MKNYYSLLFLLFISIISFAQGFAVQGIARAADNSAMTLKNIIVTF